MPGPMLCPTGADEEADLGDSPADVFGNGTQGVARCGDTRRAGGPGRRA